MILKIHQQHVNLVMLLLLLSYALGAIAGQPGNGIIVCRV